MGIWGPGNFDNDDAMAWIFNREHANDPNEFISTFESVTEPGDGKREIGECANAIAAAEVVAALEGRAGSNFPEDAMNWVHKQTSTGDLKEEARRAVDAIMSGSELREHWAASDQYEAWLASMKDLQRRLR
jgi:prophage DNA circulation protein